MPANKGWPIRCLGSSRLSAHVGDTAEGAREAECVARMDKKTLTKQETLALRRKHIG